MKNKLFKLLTVIVFVNLLVNFDINTGIAVEADDLTGSISGYKWHDLDGDGVWDAGEPPLENWTIQLTGDASASTTTDSEGYYEFNDLPAGSYTVSEVLKDGWTQRYPVVTGTHIIQLEPGEVSTGNNFGNQMSKISYGSISGYKWNDLDGDGVWDAGEPPLEGWTIQLGGHITASTTTDSEGFYIFKSLPEGNYSVSEVIETGWTQTYPGDPGTYSISLGAGEFLPNNNFGNQKPVISISGYKWHDLDGDGVWDAGESPLEDWTIWLTDGDGVLISTTTTNADGYYEFSDVDEGEYRVYEVLMGGWVQTYPTSPEYHELTVTSGSDGTGYNFGNFKLGVKSGYKWHDLDGDGVWDAGEPLLDGWTVELWKLVDSHWVLQGSAVTGDGGWSDGYYEFAGLEAGEYRVYEVLMGGWVQTYPTSPEYHEFTVVSGFNETDNDFGNKIPVGSISGYKWHDLDGDGVWDAGEPPLEGWTIQLTGDATASTTTSPSGFYIFEDLTEGSYVVSEVLQPGWTQTYPGGLGTHGVALGAGEFSTDNNFGNQEFGSISGYKWNDLDGDGVWDAGEPPLEGWTIQLTGDASASTTTDSEGYYEFNDLLAGSYTVSEVLKHNWEQTYPDVPGTHGVALGAGEASADNNFGNQFIPPPPSVGGDAETVQGTGNNHGETAAAALLLTLVAVLATWHKD